MTPAQIEAKLRQFREGTVTQQELQAFMQSLSSSDYQRWASSAERRQPGGSGAGAGWPKEGFEALPRFGGEPRQDPPTNVPSGPDFDATQDLRQLVRDTGESIIGEGRGALLERLVQQESQFNPNARSPKGARGLTQLMPATAADYNLTGEAIVDIDKNLRVGATYLRDLLFRYGNDERKALAAYNAGPGRVDGLIAARGNDWESGLPAETQTYLKKVAGGQGQQGTPGSLQEAGFIEVRPDLWLDPTTGSTIDLREDDLMNVGGRLLRRNDDGSIEVVYSPPGSDPNLHIEQDPATGRLIGINPQTGQRTDLGAFGFPGQDPASEIITDERTGERFRVNTRTGERTPLGQFGFGQPDPNVQQVTDSRTGITYNVNTSTGERTPLGTFGFPDIEPERGFALDEAGVTGFYGGQPTIRTTEETGRNSRAGLEAGTRGFESVNTLAPRLGELALSNAEFSRDVLRSPADFVARAYMTRGEESPIPQVSQADVINQLRQNIGQFNDVLGGFNVPSQYTPGGFGTPQTTPQAAAPVAPAAIAPVAAAPAPAGFSAAFGGTPVSQSPANQAALQTAVEAGRSATPAGQPVAASFESQMAELQRVAAQQQANLAATGRSVDASGTVRRLAGGGFAHPGDVAVVGERGPEVVMDMPGGFMVLNEQQLGMDPMKLKAPHAQTGGIFGFSAPQLPVPAGVTQAELDAARNLARPPAVRDVRAGIRPQPMSFGAGFALPTPQLLASLTGDEREAFRTDLAGENISLDDVEFAVRQRFAPPGGRGRARTVGFAR